MGAFSGFAGTLPDIVKKIKSKAGGGGKSSSASKSADPGSSYADSSMDSYHKGGVVRKTGVARLKKGERVLTKGQQKKLGMRKRMRGK